MTTETRGEKYGRKYFIDKDIDEAGIPWDNFVTAVQVLSFMHPSDEQMTVRQAADLFDVTDEVIRLAVKEHYWMFLVGPDDDPTKQYIDHDGD